MQKWEYMSVRRGGAVFYVVNSQGLYFTEEFYKTIDPDGKWQKINNAWVSSSDTYIILIRILDKLGSEGWEAVGFTEEGTWLNCLLKRAIV